MNIPTSFQLFGQTINIEFNEQRCSDLEAIGATRDCMNKIILTKSDKGEVLPDDTIEQVFLHEVVHQILDKICEYKLAKDERFVDLFSKALHQFITTCEY